MSADAEVSLYCCCCILGAFAFGVVIGQDTKPLLCPVVPGHEVASTVAPDTCNYVTTTYGRAVRKMKAKS